MPWSWVLFACLGRSCSTYFLDRMESMHLISPNSYHLWSCTVMLLFLPLKYYIGRYSEELSYCVLFLRIGDSFFPRINFASIDLNLVFSLPSNLLNYLIPSLRLPSYSLSSFERWEYGHVNLCWAIEIQLQNL